MLAKWENNHIDVDIPEHLNMQSPTVTLIYDAIAQQQTTAANIGFYFMKAVAFKPFRLDPLHQPRDVMLRPQQFTFGVVNPGRLQREL
jgi:hypothetical protein